MEVRSWDSAHAMTGQVEEDCQMEDKAMPSRLGKTTARSTVRK